MKPTTTKLTVTVTKTLLAAMQRHAEEAHLKVQDWVRMTLAARVAAEYDLDEA